MKFRRLDDRQEWLSEDGKWLIEKTFTAGPRGGTRIVWNLYRVEERLHLVKSARRQGDLWEAIQGD